MNTYRIFILYHLGSFCSFSFPLSVFPLGSDDGEIMQIPARRITDFLDGVEDESGSRTPELRRACRAADVLGFLRDDDIREAI